MPASVKTAAEINNIIGGNGVVDLSEAVVALAGATGIAMFAKKIGLWPKFSAVERHEVELMDAEMPMGWWRGIKQTAPAAAMAGKKIRWRHGDWESPKADENGDLLVTTPMLDQDADKLV